MRKVAVEILGRQLILTARQWEQGKLLFEVEEWLSEELDYRRGPNVNAFEREPLHSDDFVNSTITAVEPLQAMQLRTSVAEIYNGWIN